MAVLWSLRRWIGGAMGPVAERCRWRILARGAFTQIPGDKSAVSMYISMILAIPENLGLTRWLHEWESRVRGPKSCHSASEDIPVRRLGLAVLADDFFIFQVPVRRVDDHGGLQGTTSTACVTQRPLTSRTTDTLPAFWIHGAPRISQPVTTDIGLASMSRPCG